MSAGICDLDDFCDGTSKVCPADAKEPNTFVCRPAVGACDVADTCDGSSNLCPMDNKVPDNTPCSDGQFCNGLETCQSGTCSAGTDPCLADQTCDESTDMCLLTPCPAAPAGSCLTAQKSLFLIKQSSTDATKNKLIWKFIKGEPTTFAQLSDPTQTADYALCVYAAGTLAGTINVPANGMLWSMVGSSKGYKYFDSTSGTDGVQKIMVKASDANNTKELIKGRGAQQPAMLGMAGLDAPVKVQLVNHGSGTCWEANYAAPKTNTATQFKAKQ